MESAVSSSSTADMALSMASLRARMALIEEEMLSETVEKPLRSWSATLFEAEAAVLEDVEERARLWLSELTG